MVPLPTVCYLNFVHRSLYRGHGWTHPKNPLNLLTVRQQGRKMSLAINLLTSKILKLILFLTQSKICAALCTSQVKIIAHFKIYFPKHRFQYLRN